ncbi:MAG: ABC transporter permease [Gemmatimonadota bacterium]
MKKTFSRSTSLARAIVARTIWDSDGEDVVTNLDEIYHARLESHGRAAAGLWYWGQALTFGPRVWLDPRGRRTPSDRRDRSILAVWLDDLRTDAWFAVRGFRRSPGFTGVSIATLALGIAANTLIYALVSSAVLRPPPFPDPDRLVWVWPSGELSLTMASFVELERRLDNVGELTAFASREFAIRGGERPDEVLGVSVSPNHFGVLGRPPAEGRGFSAEEAQPGAEPVALISHELWLSHFGEDPSILGSRVDLFTAAAIPMVPGAFTGAPHTVIGVLPPDYRPFGYRVDVVTPLVADPDDSAFYQMGELSVLGRLAPEATAEQMRLGLVSAAQRIPGLEQDLELVSEQEVISLHTALTGHVRPALFLSLGAVTIVLLIACANVANLMLARTQSRRRELAVRAALGADRGRVARQLLTESAILATAAGAVGVGAAWILLPRLIPFLPAELALPGDAIRVDGVVLMLVAGALLVTLALAGLLPALRGTGALLSVVVGHRKGVGGNPRANRTNQILVVTQLALAAMLVSGAGLLLRSFAHLTDVETGFSARNVMTVRVAPSDARYADTELRRAFYERALAGVRSIAGVDAAGAIHFLPVADGGPSVYFLSDPTDPESHQLTGYRVVTPDYLETMQIPLLEGRSLVDTDVAGAPLVGLVNRTLAERLWPDRDPVGQRLYRTSGQEWFTVVGVTGDVRQSALGLPPNAEAYLPMAQSQWASAMTIVLRSASGGPRLAQQVEDVIWSVDPDVPITRTAPLEELMSASIAGPRFYSVLFSLFALLALLLGVIGIYGVMSYIVRQRTDEIGIRLALGATGRRILLGEILRASRVSAVGILVGLAGAIASSRVLTSLLYEVSPFDPAVFLTAAAVLGIVAVGAAFIPARRAAGVDPVVSIRGV